MARRRQKRRRKKVKLEKLKKEASLQTSILGATKHDNSRYSEKVTKKLSFEISDLGATKRDSPTPTERLNAEFEADPGSPFSYNGFYPEVSADGLFNGAGGFAQRQSERCRPASGQLQKQQNSEFNH